MEDAFGYRGQKLFVTSKDHKSELKLTPVNHFAAEMDHFSECILANKEADTTGEEGLADLRVITAIEESIQSGRSVKLDSLPRIV